MIVSIQAIGDLREYFGRETHEVLLPERASVRDLLKHIEDCWGPVLPAYLWDNASHQFRGPVILVVNKKALQNLDTRLSPDTNIQIMRAIVGG